MTDFECEEILNKEKIVYKGNEIYYLSAKQLLAIVQLKEVVPLGLTNTYWKVDLERAKKKVLADVDEHWHYKLLIK